MLKNLVKKFTSHTLNDGEVSDAPPSLTGDPSIATVSAGLADKSLGVVMSTHRPESHQHQLRRMPIGGAAAVMGGAGNRSSSAAYTNVKGARRGRSTTTAAATATLSPVTGGGVGGGKHLIRRQPPSLADSGIATIDDDLRDSGTESDEELAVIETNSIRSVPVSLTSDYYTSQQSLSASCRSSHCGSPILDQDCASWDSFGCESGGYVRNNESIADLEVELPNHHYHTRQQFKRFLKYQQQRQQISNIGPATIHEYCVAPNDAQVQQQHAGNICFVDATPEAADQKMGTRSGLRSLDHGLNQGGQDTPTVDECAAYNVQLASPSSSIDELESINGSNTLDQTELAKKEKQEAEFLVPDANALSRNVGRDRSSFIACPKSSLSCGGGGGAKSAAISGGLPAAEKRKWSQVQSADFSLPSNHRAIFSGDAGVDDSSSATPNAATSLKIQVIGETGDYDNNVVAVGALGDAADLPSKSAAAFAASVARRAPVRLLIAPPASANAAPPPPPATSPLTTAVVADSLMTSSAPLKTSPRKKCKATAAATVAATASGLRQDVDDDATSTTSSAGMTERQRPSLNFDKMREKLKNKAGRKKYGSAGTVAMKSKLRGWNAGYQLRSSSHSDCLFLPLKFPPSPPNLQPNIGD